MKELYIVRDVPRYEEECSNYCYVVKAESHAEAIDIVRKKTKHQWDWEAELADNKEVWEQIIGSIWKIKQQTNAKHLENKYPDAFLIQRNGGIIMNTSRFTITTIVENGYPHYKVHDNLTDNEIHCDLNELNETIWQLLGVQEVFL